MYMGLYRRIVHVIPSARVLPIDILVQARSVLSTDWVCRFPSYDTEV